ncbi:proline-rich receptor-like protein kinase PERK9 [Vitis riparia]|uniref:proline-rich receptor-like protein kinase PERK9 n=1 Tax=Vitis riparia TaxID=96939 RepID=UPI00155A5914|nr:proline-rich receptor-like protein kinase PERK9 [Vitis riparia]
MDRGAKSSSSSARKRTLREAPVQASTSEPPRPEAASPPAKLAPQKRPAKPIVQQPPARRYLTRSGGRPLQKRARVESSEPIDLIGQSPVPSPEPSPVPSSAPPAKPQASQPPPSEPQIPSGTAPEAIIRRPMLTQPPIEGNLDC